MKDVTHLIMWLFVLSFAGLALRNAGGFATAVNAVGGQVTSDARLLAGQG